MLLALIKTLFAHMAAALTPCAPGSSFVTLSFADVPAPPAQQPQEQAQPVQPSANGQEPQPQPQPVQPGGGGQPQPPPPPPKQLTVDRAVLWHASTVLRAMFEDTCSGGGGGGGRKGGGGGGCSSPAAVLQLSGDRPEDWEVALRLLHTIGEALDLVTWVSVAASDTLLVHGQTREYKVCHSTRHAWASKNLGSAQPLARLVACAQYPDIMAASDTSSQALLPYWAFARAACLLPMPRQPPMA